MKCPGQDTQFWNQSAIFEAQCPRCSRSVEFFKDDTTRKCGHCGHRFLNPKMDFGCAAYCPFAEQCLGDLPPELVAQQENLLKDRVAVAVKRHLKTDFKRIGRAVRRARHAEQIYPPREGGLAPVLIAALLYDLDPDAASQADVPAARALLAELKAPEPLVEKVAELLLHAGRDARNGDRDYRIVADAAAITEWEERSKAAAHDPAGSREWVEGVLSTDRARTYFRELADKADA